MVSNIITPHISGQISPHISKAIPTIFAPNQLDNLALWYENSVLARTSWNTAGSQLNNSGTGPDGKLFSGSAYEFVAANEDHIDYGGQLTYLKDTREPFFVNFWILLNSTGSAQIIWSQQNSSDNQGVSSYISGVNSKLTFQFSRSGNKLLVENDLVLSTGIWYHVKINYDGSQTGAGVSIDINGNTAVTIVTDAITQDVYTITANFGLGARGIGQTESLFFDGQIKDFVIKNTATGDDFYNNPQKFLEYALNYDIAITLAEKFQQKEGAVINYGTGNNLTFKSIAAGAYNPVVNGIEVGFQPALSGYNRYYVFDGVDDHVDINPSLFDPAADGQTIEFSSIYNNESGVRTIICYRDEDTELIIVFVNNGSLTLQVRGSDNVLKSDAVAVDKNTLITGTLTYNGVAKTASVVSNAGTISVSAFGTVSASTRLIIGAYKPTGNVTGFYGGLIPYINVNGTEFFGHSYSGGTISGSPARQNIYGSTYDAVNDLFGNTIQTPFKNQILNLSDIINDTGINKLESGNLGNIRTLVFLVKFPVASDQTIFETGGGTISLTSNAIVAAEFDGIVVDGSGNSISADIWHTVTITSDTDVNLSAFEIDEECVAQISPIAYSGTKKNASELAGLETYLQSLKD